MVSITTITFAVATLIGQTLAAPTGTTCTIGQFYCGYSLLNNGKPFCPSPSTPTRC